MIQTVRELCRANEYPDELCAVLEELDAGARAAFPGLESLVLSGSITTGDFVWRRTSEGVAFHSDVDALLFADPRDAVPERLFATIRSLEARHPHPLFRIDLSLNPVSGLRHIAKSYQMAEIREAGFVLSGRDVRPAFPAGFDPRASRQAFLANLWKPVLYWAPPGAGDDTCYALAASRLFLDLPLLVTSEAGSCVPGHRRRAEGYLAEPHGVLRVPGGPEAVAWALDVRRGTRSRDPALEQRVREFAFALVAALDASGVPPSAPDAALVQRLSRWLPRRSGRRVAGELRSLLRAGGLRAADLAWLRQRKEAVGAAALLGVLAYLPEVACLPEAEEASPPPRATAALLASLARRPAIEGRGLGFVYAAKNAYWEGLQLVYPALSKKESGIAGFLESPR